MAVLTTDDDARRGRDVTRLYVALCDCAGPQPSAGSTRADEHAADCPYRAAIEPGDGRAPVGNRS